MTTRLAQLRALEQEATKGPWMAHITGRHGEREIVAPDCGGERGDVVTVAHCPMGDRDAAFIVAARSSFSRLLDIAEAAKQFMDNSDHSTLGVPLTPLRAALAALEEEG